MRNLLFLLTLLVSGILHANAGNTPCRDNAPGLMVSGSSAAQPGQGKIVNGFVQTGFNDQIDDNGIDDDTIDNLIRNIAACLLLSYTPFQGLKAAVAALSSHSRFSSRSSRILFTRNIRI